MSTPLDAWHEWTDRVRVANDIVEVVSESGIELKRLGSEHIGLCPFHTDTNPSLNVNRERQVYICRACRAGGDVFKFIEMSLKVGFAEAREHLSQRAGIPMLERKTGEGGCISPGASPTTHAGCTLVGYAQAKKLQESALRGYGLTEITYEGAPCVRIPYFDAQRCDGPVQFRVRLSKGPDGEKSFRWKRGSKPTMYGLWKLGEMQKHSRLTLVEGPSDCHTLWQHGEPAVGVPGASLWREDWAALVEGFGTIYVVIEPGASGQAMLKWLGKSSIRRRAQLVRLNGAKDPSGLYLEDPDRFPELWRAALDAAVPWADADAEEIEARKSSAWATCETLARCPDILGAFDRSLSALGLVGERSAAKLVYLAVTSRLDRRPVPIVLKGPSSAGKSVIVQRTLEHFPPDAYHALTGMSERALIYDDAPLKHRTLVVYEANGLENEFTAYLLRSLLSEGRIEYQTSEKTGDGIRGRKIVREGPTGFVSTTTAVRLHAEVETRMLSVLISDTREQTTAVLRVQAAEAQGETVEAPDLSEWRALQEWLALSGLRVVIPFASRLADLIPPAAVRLRRDFPTLLALIRAHALLHAASRDRDAEGRVVAAVTDYSEVRALVGELIAAGVQATVPRSVRETVEAVRELAGDSETTATKVGRRLKLDRSSAGRRLLHAAEGGYIKNLEDRPGRPGRWSVVSGEALPVDQAILPDPETLGGCVRARASEDIHPPPSLPRIEFDPIADAAAYTAAFPGVTT